MKILGKMNKDPEHYVHYLCELNNVDELRDEIKKIFDLCLKNIQVGGNSTSMIDNIKIIYAIFDNFKAKDVLVDLYIDFFFKEEFYEVSKDRGICSLINKTIVDLLKYINSDTDIDVTNRIDFFLKHFIEKNDKISVYMMLQYFNINHDSFDTIMQYISNFKDNTHTHFLKMCKELSCNDRLKEKIIHYLFEHNKIDHICALRDSNIISSNFIEDNVISQNMNWSNYVTENKMLSFFYYLYSSKSCKQSIDPIEQGKSLDNIFFNSLKTQDSKRLEQLFDKFSDFIPSHNNSTDCSYSIENIKNFLLLFSRDDNRNIDVFNLLIRKIDSYDKNFKNVLLNDLVIKYNLNNNTRESDIQLIQSLISINADVDISCGFQDQGMALDRRSILVYAIYNDCFDLANLLMTNHKLSVEVVFKDSINENSLEEQKYKDFLLDNHILAIAYDRFLRALARDNNKENQKKSADLVRTILEKYSDKAFDIFYSDGKNVFNSIISDNQLSTYFLQNGDDHFIQNIINHSINDHKAFSSSFIAQRKDLMMSLAEAGYLDSIHDIMTQFPDCFSEVLHHVNANGDNLLFLMIKFLIQNNTQDNIDKFTRFFENNTIFNSSSLHHIDSRKYNLLHYAYMLGNQNIINILVRHTTLQVSPKERLISLCEGGCSLKLIQQIDINHLQKYINKKMQGNMTLLHFITQSNGTEKANIIKFLISNGANVNNKNVLGRTPLMNAVLSGDLDLVRLLLSYSSTDVNATDIHGNTALHLAISQSTQNIVNVLIKDCRVNVNKNNKHGILPISYAYCSYKALESDDKKDNISGNALNQSELINIMRRLVEAGSDIPKKHTKSKFILSIIWSFIKSRILTLLNKKIIQRFTGKTGENIVQIGIDVKHAFEVSNITTEFVKDILEGYDTDEFLKQMSHDMIANHHITSFGNVSSNEELLSKHYSEAYEKKAIERNNYMLSLNMKRQYMNIRRYIDQMSVFRRSRSKLVNLLESIKKQEYKEKDCLYLFSQDQEILDLLDYDNDKLVKYMISTVEHTHKNNFTKLIDDIVLGNINVSCETFYKAIKLIEAKEKILFHKKNKWFSYEKKLYSTDIAEIEDYIIQVSVDEIEKHKKAIETEKNKYLELKNTEQIINNDKSNYQFWNNIFHSAKNIFARGVGSSAGLLTLARNNPNNVTFLYNVASPVIQSVVGLVTWYPLLSLCVVSSLVGVSKLKNLFIKEANSNLFESIEEKQKQFYEERNIQTSQIIRNSSLNVDVYNCDNILQYSDKWKESLESDKVILQEMKQIKNILFDKTINIESIKNDQKKPLKQLIAPHIVHQISLEKFI